VLSKQRSGMPPLQARDTPSCFKDFFTKVNDKERDQIVLKKWSVIKGQSL
jgi:hypothetical protein